jgi:hypothetical protein
MKNRLQLNSPLYLKRLSKELHKIHGPYVEIDGKSSRLSSCFYSSVVGALMIRLLGESSFSRAPAFTKFFDGYGSEIVASQDPKQA